MAAILQHLNISNLASFHPETEQGTHIVPMLQFRDFLIVRRNAEDLHPHIFFIQITIIRSNQCTLTFSSFISAIETNLNVLATIDQGLQNKHLSWIKEIGELHIMNLARPFNPIVGFIYKVPLIMAKMFVHITAHLCHPNLKCQILNYRE
ncbi:hypothetical protein D3C74_385330 [compost metagenome]